MNPSTRVGRLTILSACFAAGIAVAWQFDSPSAWPWLGGAGVAALVALLTVRRSRVAFTALAVAALCAGSAWLIIHHYHVSPQDIASFASPRPKIVQLTGVATRNPEMRQRSAGSLAAFDYRRPATYVPMDVDTVIDRDGHRIPAAGAVYVRFDETVPPFRAGDRLTITGVLRAPSPPRNPGEFNFARYARSLGQAGVITVPSRELVQIDPAPRAGVRNKLLRWRESTRLRATQWLLSDLPAASPQQDALLVALLLGRRDPDLDAINDSFQRVGLAYLLAISGLHLAVVAGGVLLVARLFGVTERWRGLLLIIIALAYIFLVEVRLPVLRAAVMMIGAGGALSLGRQVRISGAIALAAVALLIWRPDQLVTAGFQLSFGVVLGLTTLTPRLRQRWFGRAEQNPVSVGQMITEWLKTSFAAAVVAWVIATPIVAWHFAMICPLAAPLSVAAIPLVSVLLLVGYAKMVLAAVLPSAALIVAVPLAMAAQILLAIVTIIDEAPGSTLNIPYPSVAWAIGACIWGAAWICRGLFDSELGRPRWSMIAACLLLIAWLYWPRLPIHDTPPLRLDVVAVGDGSCYVLRSNGETVVFDAGSQDLDVGDQVLVPTLRRMNIAHVDAIVISHNNLDHYCGVIELVDAFNCREVLITPFFRDEVARDTGSSATQLMQMLYERDVSVRVVAAGYKRQLGEATLTLLHPAEEGDYERVNNTSMVMLAESVGRSVLLAADIEERAVDELLSASPDLRVDVSELPHHGSFTDASRRFIAHIEPSIVFQSCGWSRYDRDRWADDCAGIERLITARDGMCTVIVHSDGTITTRRFVKAAD